MCCKQTADHTIPPLFIKIPTKRNSREVSFHYFCSYKQHLMKMKEKLDFSEVPYQYAMCLNQQCLKADTCLRQLAEQSVPEKVEYWSIISPKRLNSIKGDCPYYRSNIKARYAKGFIGILESLPHKQMENVISSGRAWASSSSMESMSSMNIFFKAPTPFSWITPRGCRSSFPWREARRFFRVL